MLTPNDHTGIWLLRLTKHQCFTSISMSTLLIANPNLGERKKGHKTAFKGKDTLSC